MASLLDVANTGAAALRFLTGEDFQLLARRAHQRRFQRGEVILAEGVQREAIFLLRTGFVRVERGHLGRGIAIARRGPGDVFGEMSFLEGGGASASVIADEDVEVAVIEGADLNAKLAADPGFATRFYRSLAVRLSERVAEVTAALPPLMLLHRSDEELSECFGQSRFGGAPVRLQLESA